MPFRFGELITTRMPEDQAGLRVVRSRITYTAEEASHAVMLSHPKEVAKVIEEAAGGRQN